MILLKESRKSSTAKTMTMVETTSPAMYSNPFVAERMFLIGGFCGDFEANESDERGWPYPLSC
jgi:hypothetical protein